MAVEGIILDVVNRIFGSVQGHETRKDEIRQNALRYMDDGVDPTKVFGKDALNEAFGVEAAGAIMNTVAQPDFKQRVQARQTMTDLGTQIIAGLGSTEGAPQQVMSSQFGPGLSTPQAAGTDTGAAMIPSRERFKALSPTEAEMAGQVSGFKNIGTLRGGEVNEAGAMERFRGQIEENKVQRDFQVKLARLENSLRMGQIRENANLQAENDKVNAFKQGFTNLVQFGFSVGDAEKMSMALRDGKPILESLHGKVRGWKTTGAAGTPQEKQLAKTYADATDTLKQYTDKMRDLSKAAKEGLAGVASGEGDRGEERAQLLNSYNQDYIKAYITTQTIGIANQLQAQGIDPTSEEASQLIKQVLSVEALKEGLKKNLWVPEAIMKGGWIRAKTKAGLQVSGKFTDLNPETAGEGEQYIADQINIALGEMGFSDAAVGGTPDTGGMSEDEVRNLLQRGTQSPSPQPTGTPTAAGTVPPSTPTRGFVNATPPRDPFQRPR